MFLYIILGLIILGLIILGGGIWLFINVYHKKKDKKKDKVKQSNLKDFTQRCDWATASDDQAVDCPVGKYCTTSDWDATLVCLDMDDKCGGPQGCGCGQFVCNPNYPPNAGAGFNPCDGTVSECLPKPGWSQLGKFTGGTPIFDAAFFNNLDEAKEMAERSNYKYIVWTDGGLGTTQFFSNDLSPLSSNGADKNVKPQVQQLYHMFEQK